MRVELQPDGKFEILISDYGDHTWVLSKDAALRLVLRLMELMPGQQESERARAMCHDCGALEGALHEYGCDMESCPFCGHQLITCGCAYELLHLYDSATYDRFTCFLPPSIYEGGLDKDQEAEWLKTLAPKGRTPRIKHPNPCAKRGAPRPDALMAPDEDREKHTEPTTRGKMLCQSCYSWIKGLIDQFATPEP